MKTPPKLIALFAGAALFLASGASASTTDPVGYVTLSGNSGGYIASSPLVKSAVFSSQVASVNGSDVQVGATVPTLDGASFVQVTSGSLTGTIVDVSSVSGDTITLASETPLSAGDTLVIRPHFIISDLGDSFADGTSVTVYNSDGSPTTASFQDNFLGTGWVGESDTPIYPGEGFVLNTPAPFSIVFTGAVSLDPVVFSASSGVTNLVGSVSPNTADADQIFGSLPESSSISVYEQGGSLTSPTIYSKQPDFLGGGWTPALSEIDFANSVAIVVVPGSDAPVELPAVQVSL